MTRQSKPRPLTAEELSGFCDQMAMILRSGISSSEGIHILKEDAASRETEEILNQILVPLDQGESFYTALAGTGMFPQYMLNMVNIGELSGKLDEVMGSLSLYYARESSIAQAVRSAVAYPCAMIAMMVVIVLVLITKIMPIFNQVYTQLGSEMTGVAGGLLSLGTALGRYASLFICLIAAVLILGFILWKTGRLSLPLPKKLRSAISSGRFASGMALTLSSGLDPDESLEMIKRLVASEELSAKISSCQAAIADGSSFGEAIAASGIFTGLYGHMVSIGFKTGATDEVMQKVAEKYEEEVDIRISRAIAVLEPSLVAVLSVIVGVVLLSVMLPLLGIMSGMGIGG